MQVFQCEVLCSHNQSASLSTKPLMSRGQCYAAIFVQDVRHSSARRTVCRSLTTSDVYLLFTADDWLETLLWQFGIVYNNSPMCSASMQRLAA